jgi:hypothetical protein
MVVDSDVEGEAAGRHLPAGPPFLDSLLERIARGHRVLLKKTKPPTTGNRGLRSPRR